MTKRIMVCLDGSKNSLRGLDKAISFAKQSDAVIIGVHSDTSFSAFSALEHPYFQLKNGNRKQKN